MTIQQFKSAFKKADTTVNKAVARYKKALRPLYMYQCEDMGGDIYHACDLLIANDGHICVYATDKAFTIFRRRGNKFYIKPQNGSNANLAPTEELEWVREGWHYVLRQRQVGQDYLDLRALELAIEDALTKRNDIVSACNREHGINLYAD